MRFGKITANTGIENRKAAKIKSALPGLAEAFNAEVGSQPQVEMSMSTPAVSLSTAVPLSTSVKLSTSAPVIIDEKFVNTESALAVLKDMDEPGVVHSGRIPVDETPVIKKSNTRAKKKISLPSKVRIAKTAKTPKKTEKVIKSDNIVRTHIVKPGDTLVSLAQQYYGDRSRWVSIYRTNENKIEKGVLKPGEKLILP